MRVSYPFGGWAAAHGPCGLVEVRTSTSKNKHQLHDLSQTTTNLVIKRQASAFESPYFILCLRSQKYRAATFLCRGSYPLLNHLF